MFPILLLIFVYCLTEANLHSPRMVFTYKESPVKRFPLSEQNLPVQILLERQTDAVTAVGKTHLALYNFSNTEQVPEGRKVQWNGCPNNDCNYKITVVHQREEGKPLFVCGTNSKTVCCDMDLSNTLTCVPTAKVNNVREFVFKEGEQSVLVETEQSTDLYVTYSGAHEHVGIHKFGSKRVRPASHDEEQYYLGLVLSRREDEPLQNKVYAFFKQKNKDTGLGSDMWLPFVSQVCMADAGGSKSNLQFSWTSLMNARLYCGHPGTKQHFSELVDVATVHAYQWQDTRVYALFRNEWGMSAVCVYKIGDIENVFTNSHFIGSEADKTDRKKCVRDSTTIPSEVLKRIEPFSEMKQWVHPVNKSGPVLLKHHNYTRIYVDASLQSTVMFLSLSNGAIHKALQMENHSFIIAEYQPFNYSAHILNLIFHPSSRKLYVNSEAELVQIDMGSCSQYGNICQECVLSRDPYCSWKKKRCTSETGGTYHNVVQGNHSICQDQASFLQLSAKGTNAPADTTVKSIKVPSQSRYFLRCPMSSHHAKYTWHGPEGSRSCNQMEGQCLFLIDSMTPKQEGNYKCESEEMGYQKVLVQYQLKSIAAGRTFHPTLWLFVAAVFKSVWF
ncbi:semaphorin-7A [Anableps anableps]